MLNTISKALPTVTPSPFPVYLTGMLPTQKPTRVQD